MRDVKIFELIGKKFYQFGNDEPRLNSYSVGSGERKAIEKPVGIEASAFQEIMINKCSNLNELEII